MRTLALVVIVILSACDTGSFEEFEESDLVAASPYEGQYDGSVAQNGQQAATATFSLTEKTKGKFMVKFDLQDTIYLAAGRCGRQPVPKQSWELPVVVTDKQISGSTYLEVSGVGVNAYFSGKFDDKIENATLFVNLDIQKRMCSDPQVSGTFTRDEATAPAPAPATAAAAQ